MSVEVEGEDINPEEVTRTLGWRIAGERKSRPRQRDLGLSKELQSKLSSTGRGPENAKCKLIEGARMPALPREDTKIVVRPRGGLNISKVGHVEVGRAIYAAAGVSKEERIRDVICPNYQQNIVIISTSKRENANRYVRVTQIVVQGNKHEVSAYESAPHGMSKGVIRGVPLGDTVQEINENIVTEFNPTAVEANRIANTTSVVIAFNGPKVPNYVRYGGLLAKCSLYRKQIDICYKCGRLGHRMDVCPNPTDRICRGCGAPNPDEQHTCTPKCDLCGGKHLTADKVCKARFKIPYVVRKRQWERRNANTSPEACKPPRQERPATSGNRSRSLSRDDRKGRSNSCASRPGSRASSPGDVAGSSCSGRRRESRSRSKTRGQTPAKNAAKQVGWADRSPIALSNNDFPPLPSTPKKDCEECTQLKALIVRQNQQISELLARMEALEKSKSSEDDTKRKIAKRDAQSEPPVTAMEAEKIESRPSEEPAWAEPIQALTAMVTQLTSQLGLVTSRMAKFDTLEANVNQLILTTQKAKKGAPYGKPCMGSSLTTTSLSQDGGQS